MYIIGNAYQKFSLDKILVIQQRSRHLGLSLATLLKKRLWHRCFLVSFAKILRNFFYKTSLVAASEKKIFLILPLYPAIPFLAGR